MDKRGLRRVHKRAFPGIYWKQSGRAEPDGTLTTPGRPDGSGVRFFVPF